jgi:hypothetical protein
LGVDVGGVNEDRSNLPKVRRTARNEEEIWQYGERNVRKAEKEVLNYDGLSTKVKEVERNKIFEKLSWNNKKNQTYK